MSFKYKIAFNGDEGDNLWVTQIKSIELFEQYHGKDTPRLIFDIADTVCPDDPGHEYIQAWRFDNDDSPTRVVIDMDVAKEMFMLRLRHIRNTYLSAWDEEHNIAQWTNNKKRATEINKIKQRLRDIPQDIDNDIVSANSIKEMHNISHKSFATDKPSKLVGPIQLNV